MASVDKVTQVTDNRFLNYYELSTTKRTGEHGRYFMASRAAGISALDLSTGQNQPDGVVIFSLTGQRRDQVVLVRQYRYPIAGWIYELPAGLIEKGENHKETAVREMKEETGLSFRPLDVDPMYERPFYNSVGEELDVVLADCKEAERILKEERVAANCAYMLMHFIAHPDDAFSFLRRS